MIKTGINQETASKIRFGAGVYFCGVTYNEKVAPTEAEIRQHIIGATKDGGSISIKPEFYNAELDGQFVKTKELQQKVGESATLDTSFAELTPDLVEKFAIGKKDSTTDGKYDVITSIDELKEGHHYQGFGFYGNFLDGRPVIIIFKNALCTSGFTMDAKNKDGSVFKGTFECESDLKYGVDKLPYAIFIYKKGSWVPDNQQSSNQQEETQAEE